MNSFMRILLMYANEYDIKDESGRSVRGCTINFSVRMAAHYRRRLKRLVLLVISVQSAHLIMM